MMGKRQRRGEKLFYVGLSLEDRVPADHPLRRIDRAIDFDFVRGEVAHLYGVKGNESVDPALLLRVMLLVFLESVRSEREFMRQLPLRLDWLWFCRLDLDSDIPNHSVLSKARRRWGEELFARVFERVLEACVRAGLVEAKTVHADSTLLKASADREGRVSRKLWEQLEQGLQTEQTPASDEKKDDPPGGSGGTRLGKIGPVTPERSERATLNNQLVSPVDPDAATHKRHGTGTILGYRDHRLTDDYRGIILATHVTPADGDDGAQLPLLLGQMTSRLGCVPREAAGDSMYGTRRNYEYCQQRGIKPYLKKRPGPGTPGVWWVRLLPERCSPWRAVKIRIRRRIVAEGSFAEAHTRMNHRRCRWRGRWRVQVQAYLIATAQNLKKLIKGVRREMRGSAAVAMTQVRAGPCLSPRFRIMIEPG
jgi:transposase